MGRQYSKCKSGMVSRLNMCWWEDVPDTQSPLENGLDWGEEVIFLYQKSERIELRIYLDSELNAFRSFLFSNHVFSHHNYLELSNYFQTSLWMHDC